MNRRGQRRHSRPVEAPETLSLQIDELGARGDGIAHAAGRTFYVPFAVPGDVVDARVVGKRGDGLVAELIEITSSSPHRVDPACRHFGTCGGCVVQNFDRAEYLLWKRRLVQTALERRGLGDVQIEQPIATPSAGRRRADLAARRLQSGVVLGFFERASHKIVDLAECPVLEPELTRLLAPLREELGHVLPSGQAAAMVINSTDTGLDVAVETGHTLALEARERLAAFAQGRDLARLSWNEGQGPIPIVERRVPVLRLGATNVEVPPAAFLQASRTAERAMQGFVLEAIGKASSIIDLYAGIGTLTIPLVPDRRVHLVEGDERAVAAAIRAARTPGAAGRLTVERRDLARTPLRLDELARYGAAVFDPPRAGAAAQASALADGAVPVVVAVSCDPGTFARDARLLVDGGYVLERVVPIDQFLWSSHVELVACFRRKQV